MQHQTDCCFRRARHNTGSVAPSGLQVEEQLCETAPDDSTFHVEKMEKQSVTTRGESGSEHQEDLVEGDLGLGTTPALTREA
ncbi:hypothetical protein INR49_014860 [Caranx melampygus]|nr:hypothetical protein INR49_014860 [Caranx melampygus]